MSGKRTEEKELRPSSDQDQAARHPPLEIGFVQGPVRGVPR